ncbi:MAG: hypothetical protein ABSE16_14710 [Verrucomicrobiota bacterium]|jgi:chromosome segregation and condensation protein ScpB
MTAWAQLGQLEKAYSARFDNLDELEDMSFFTRPEFSALLQKALDRGTPLTRAEVEAAFSVSLSQQY